MSVRTELVTSRWGFYWITARFDYAGHAAFPHTAVISYHNPSSHLCISASEWQRSRLPLRPVTYTSEAPITKHTRTRVDHIPAALCCVSLQHLITNICACVCYYSDSLQWAKTSFLHTCLITHFSLSPISCTAAGHMAKSCCGRSYATVERTDWLLPLSLLRQRKQGQLINGAQQAGRTGFYQVWTGII